ncbi:MAG: glycosyltransferase family 2 protein [Ignavibacteriaceae bacterium]
MNNISENDNSAAIIPFFNEADTIDSIIKSVLQYVDFVVAVNDGSTDSSKNRITINERVFILSNDRNEGKGSALRKGFLFCIEKKFRTVITIDADLQHDPSCIPDLIRALDNSDIVIGNRLNDLSSMPVQRILSNKLTSLLLSLKTGINIKDSQCGFRAFRGNVLPNILPSFPGYEAESEMIIKAARANLKVDFVPVPTIYAGEKSKMNPINAITGFLKVLFMH